MLDKIKKAILLHTSGATVRHHTPFEMLESFKNDVELSKEFIEKWVIPFYMDIGQVSETWVNKLLSVKDEITTDITKKNLGDFDWRTRQTGAFFAAIKNQTEFLDIIGIHLLKSEVTYAGKVYCEVLASFNLPESVDYLNQYLDYYLKRPELYFDQREAMEAILYLDRKNGTNHFGMHANNWKNFIKDKPYWPEEINTDSLEKQLHLIETVKQKI
ncbi:MAG: DUF6000 family protein [Bacteroidia bacterium]